MRDTAYAKINLALHVRERRADGYHELETLFAFVDCGDTVKAITSASDQLTIFGEFAAQLTDPLDNIVSKALGLLPRNHGLHVTVEKNLPIAAGLGGGSADAGAIFRIVRQLDGLPDDWRRRAAKLGADVPACVDSRTCIGRGTGSNLEIVESDLNGAACLLVNPRVPLATGSVFAGWDRLDRGPMPTGSVSQIAREGRNDLEGPAIELCPVIGDVLKALQDTNAHLVRMSGSGATCFALFEDDDAMQQAFRHLTVRYSHWWLMSGHLR